MSEPARRPSNCSDCRYWWDAGPIYSPGPYEDGSRGSVHYAQKERMCRRYPRYVWRRETEWCGEHMTIALAPDAIPGMNENSEPGGKR
jgi:hypothetical protein